MKKLSLLSSFFICLLFVLTSASSCNESVDNTSAIKEQAQTEVNQSQLNATQPAPRITWSLERDNLIKRFKLQNDRAVTFFMYVFIEGVSVSGVSFITSKSEFNWMHVAFIS